MKRPELLLPGGSLDVLKVAVLYGADAVYIGGEAFGLRAKARNFSRAEMEEGIAFAHEHGAKVYVTANIFAHDADLAGAAQYFRELAEIIIELTDSRSKIVYRPLPSDDPIQRKPLIDLARNELDWKPEISLRDGLTKTIEYFMQII